MERDREEWTDEDERHPERPPEPMPVQEETREAEEEYGPIEDAVEGFDDE